MSGVETLLEPFRRRLCFTLKWTGGKVLSWTLSDRTNNEREGQERSATSAAPLHLAQLGQLPRGGTSAVPAATRQVESEKQDLSRTDASLSVLITHERTKEREEEKEWRSEGGICGGIQQTNERKL